MGKKSKRDKREKRKVSRWVVPMSCKPRTSVQHPIDPTPIRGVDFVEKADSV
jgi:hypothetical protein